MSAPSPADLRWLDSAVRIAMPYRGTTAENPTVSAIVVTPQGVMAGRGVTAPGGRPHAEPQALAMAGERVRGATLYVTLEPCNHWGKTPPCVDAVIASGVARVVCGLVDPDPRTAGQSIAKMRAAGIDVFVAGDYEPARILHRGFLSRIERRRPYVTAKLAVSADRMIGRRDRGNVAITGEEARRWTHMQRALSEAVMVGAGTAIADDPRLNVRLPGLEERKPVRIVVEGERAVPRSLSMFNDGGSEVIVFKAENNDLGPVLGEIAKRGIGRVLLEGGAALTESLLGQGLVDQFHVLTSDAVVGPEGVPASVHGSLSERLRELGFIEVERRALGSDKLVTYERT